jgi:hypothetical protein
MPPRNRPPDHLPAAVRDHPEVVKACYSRDVGKLFRLVGNLTEEPERFSNSHLARRCGLSKSRVAEYMDRKRQATSVDVLARVADGLHIPGARFQLAPRPWEARSDRRLPGSPPADTDRVEHAFAHPRALDTGAVAQLRQRVRDLDARYDQAPSTALLAQAGQLLGQVGFLAAHATGDAAARRLMQVHTEAATLMGQLVWDASQRRDNTAAHAHLDQAVTAARELGDPVAEARALLRKSFVSLYGERDPMAALALTEAGERIGANRSRVLAALAVLHTAEAHAMLGDARSSEQALSRADTLFGRVDPADPAIELYSPSQFGRLAGSCYLSLRQVDKASIILAQTAGADCVSPKSRAIVVANLALAYIGQRALDGAVAALHDAIGLVEQTRGGGGLNLVFAAARELRPWRETSDVAEVYDRLLTLMTP